MRVVPLLVAHGARLHLLDPEPVEPAGALSDAGIERGRGPGQTRLSAALASLDQDARALVEPVHPAAGEPAGAVAGALAATLARVSVVVGCLDRPSFLLDLLAHACWQHDRPLVLAELHEHGASVAWFAGRDPRLGCATCLRMHWEERDPFARQLAPYLRRRFPRAATWRHDASALIVDLASHFAAMRALGTPDAASAEAASVAASSTDASPARAQPACARRWLVDGETLQHSEHDVPPHPRCARCFPQPRPDRARLRRAAERGFQRLAHGPVDPPVPLPRLLDRLRGQVGRHAGMVLDVRQVAAQWRPALARFCRRRGLDPGTSAIANMHQATATTVHASLDALARDAAEGSDLDDERAAEAIAIIEAIERHFTMRHIEPGRVLHASLDALGRDALDPRAFTQFAPHQYGQPGFRARPFSPGETTGWIWGVRLRDGRPLLVPVALIQHQPGLSIYPVNSNGAACHTSLHRAALGAIYEIVERDALMLAWLHRLSLPRLALTGRAPDPHGLRAELDRLGFALEIADITTDLGIPVLLGVLRDRHQPHFLITNPVAGPDPARVLGKLARELVQFALRYLVDRNAFRGPLARSRDPAAVQTLRDHLLFYQHADKVAEASFLTASPRRHAIAHVFGHMSDRADADADPARALAHLVDTLSEQGHDVIAVDCTPPLVRALGLHVVKVLIPGLVPLYEGPHMPLASERLLEAPRGVGLRRRRARIEELNPWPHPFW
ncbi:MAG TPA: YcaO-like family protein [Haliangium sp.]|nr:YcaO-like family protein [Haliangium sp.]